MPARLYLDNAATGWPKPEAVYRAVDRWQREVGASYARGTSAAADQTRELVDRARRGVARLLGEPDPRRIAFAASGTDALNTAIFGLVRPGDHVVTSVVEHNAVLRPLRWLANPERDRPIDLTAVGCDGRGVVAADAVVAALRPETRLVVLTHASNVTGAVQPVEAVAAETRRRGTRLLVDAAQTAGRWPIDVRAMGADAVAAPGHKGLCGPLGTGLLWLAPGVEADLQPFRHGGAASGGDLDRVPERMPDKLECGSANAPGLAGLAAGIEHVLSVGVEAVRAALAERRQRLADALAAIPGVTVYGPHGPSLQAGVVSFSAEGYDPNDLASYLAAAAGVESRAGLHCAPDLHRALGTFARGGLVRFSPGAETSHADLDRAAVAVRELLATPPS